MPRGTRRTLHWYPGGDGLACGVGGGFYTTDLMKVTCQRCLAVVPAQPDPETALEGRQRMKEIEVTEDMVEAGAKALWVSQQKDREWAERAVDDMFSPPDDWPDEALEAEKHARAVLRAALGASGLTKQLEAFVLELQHPGNCENCGHKSDCSLHNRPALAVEPCDC